MKNLKQNAYTILLLTVHVISSGLLHLPWDKGWTILQLQQPTDLSFTSVNINLAGFKQQAVDYQCKCLKCLIIDLTSV